MILVLLSFFYVHLFHFYSSSNDHFCFSLEPKFGIHSIDVKTSIDEEMTGCRMLDSMALVTIFQEMGGGDWTFDATQYFDIEVGIYGLVDVPNVGNTWNFNNPIDQWYGVELNSEGCVLSLILPSVGLTGNLSSAIGDLEFLEKLYLPDNQIEGTLPIELYSLFNLRELFIRENMISDTLSAEIRNLVELTGIELTFNNLSGILPPEIGELKELETLFIAGNNLEGIIPSEITDLQELIRLNLCCNHLDGSLPDSIGRLKKLRFLFLNDNMLSGVLPNSIVEMESLFQCAIYSNNLNGSLPLNIGNLQDLRILQIDNNQFSGPIPNSLTNIDLRVLTLSQNKFDGSFPNFSNAPLERLLINDNCFVSFPNHSGITTWKFPFESWSGCQVQGNKLTFEDIIPNMPIADSALWTYSVQDSIYVDTIINAFEGSNLLIDLGIDEAIENNQYVWFKDGDTLLTSASNKLMLQDISETDRGEYYCQVKNELAPDLILFSRKITLEISLKPIEIIPINSLITPLMDGFNDFLIFEDLPIQYPENRIYIFNRYGNKVFEESPYQNNWNGTYDGDSLPDGTYYYMLFLETGLKPLKGVYNYIKLTLIEYPQMKEDIISILPIIAFVFALINFFNSRNAVSFFVAFIILLGVSYFFYGGNFALAGSLLSILFFIFSSIFSDHKVSPKKGIFLSRLYLISFVFFTGFYIYNNRLSKVEDSITHQLEIQLNDLARKKSQAELKQDAGLNFNSGAVVLIGRPSDPNNRRKEKASTYLNEINVLILDEKIKIEKIILQNNKIDTLYVIHE